jgi:hypothetical protein
VTQVVFAAVFLGYLGLLMFAWPYLLALRSWFERKLAARRDEEPRSWFDHQRFVKTDLVDRVKHYSRPVVIEHPCSYGGDLLEYPVTTDSDADFILDVLGDIEVL